jgi:hypothetical protein
LMGIQIRGSAPLTNGSGSNSGSDFSLQRLKGSTIKKKIVFSPYFCLVTYLQAYYLQS